MSRDEIMYLRDIAASCDKILRFTKSLGQPELIQDERTYDAVVRNLEIIGEAVKNISVELKDRFPNIQWKELAGLRDKLIHHYFGVNYDIVWHVVKNELPDILYQLDEIENAEKQKKHDVEANSDNQN